MVDFSFNAIQQRILDRLRASQNWANILYDSTNMRLIDAFAKELEYSSQYGEMALTESKWNIARNKSSLLSEIDFFNYSPFRKVGAIGSVRVSSSSTFNTSYPVQILIPKYSTFSNGNDIYVCTTENKILFPTETYIDIPVVQGVPQTLSYTASGSIYETITINNDSIENYYFDLFVNGVLWSVIDNIRLAETGSDLVYTIKNKIDFSGVILRAGNDYFGKKLNSQDSVIFKYIETLGDLGNILSANIITNVESSFVDNNNDPVTLYCTNLEAINGGQTYEDIESIRTNAPRFYQTGNRAISLTDYIAILENYPYIVKANAWGESEYNIDNGNPMGTYIAPQENVVHVCGLTTDGQSINSTQETNIRNDINLLKPPTDVIQFENIQIVYLIFNIVAYISNRSYTNSEITQNIITTLSETFAMNLAEFKKDLYFSDYVSLIDQVTGINHHNTTVDCYVLKTFNTAYESNLSPLIYNVTPNTVSVYVKTSSELNYTLVATDNGVSGWDFEAGYTGSGSVVYATGEMNIAITSGLSGAFSNYTIKVVFSKDSNDILLTQRSHILLYGASNISIIYM